VVFTICFYGGINVASEELLYLMSEDSCWGCGVFWEVVVPPVSLMILGSFWFVVDVEPPVAA
jgi:hypothetical protein